MACPNAVLFAARYAASNSGSFIQRNRVFAEKKPKATKQANTRAQKPHVAPSKRRSEKSSTSAKKRGRVGKQAGEGARHGSKTAGAARDGSKTAKVLDLLKRPGGATTKELIKATGWQPHSVRGFLSGTVGKKMGLAVTSTKGADGERSYSVKG